MGITRQGQRRPCSLSQGSLLGWHVYIMNKERKARKIETGRHLDTHPSTSTYSQGLVEEPEVLITDILSQAPGLSQAVVGRILKCLKFPTLLPSWGGCDELSCPWFYHLSWRRDIQM